MMERFCEIIGDNLETSNNYKLIIYLFVTSGLILSLCVRQAVNRDGHGEYEGLSTWRERIHLLVQQYGQRHVFLITWMQIGSSVILCPLFFFLKIFTDDTLGAFSETFSIT